MIKYLYTSVATTGFNSETDDIIKMAFLLEEKEASKSEIIDKVVFNLKPRDGRLPNTISQEALKFNNVTVEDLRKYTTPSLVCGKLLDFFREYKEDTIVPVCHNSEFDLSFLDNFIRRYTSYKLNNFLHHKSIDLMSIASFVEFTCDCKFENYKFNTLCNALKFDHKPESITSKVSNTRKINHAFKEACRYGGLVI